MGQSMTLTQTYLDAANVYVVTSDGKDFQLTTGGISYDPQLAPNNRTVGWLVVTEYSEYEGGGLSVTEELVIYQDGQVINKLRPGGFIRDWGFWDNGDQVAIYSGPLHFAGFYLLFDISTGKILDESNDSDDNPPEWVNFIRGW
jgi:hypothetical protein